MNELALSLNIVLANSFVMYFKAHSHHWNVKGMNFSQLHGFFGDIYEEVFAAVDSTAEEIRSLGEDAPKTLSDMYQYTTLNEGNVVSSAEEMLQDLLIANSGVVDSLNKAMEYASKNNDQGLMDFLAGRLDTHKKHAWMIRSHLQ